MIRGRTIRGYLERRNLGLFRQGLLVLADQCGYSLISFVMGILLARSCRAEVYGLFVLGMTVVFFAKVVQRSLVSVPFSVLYPRYARQEQASYLANTALMHVLVTGLLAGLTGLAAWIFSGSERLGQAGPLPVCFMLLILGSLSADFLRMVLITRRRIRTCLLLSLPAQGCILAWLGGFYAQGRLTVSAACLILCAGYGIFVLGSLALSGIAVRPAAGRWRDDARANFEQGRWILSGTLVSYLGLPLLPWITLIWWETEVVAAVGVLTTLTCVLRPLLVSLVHFLTPRMSEMIQAGDPERVRECTLGMLAILSAAGLVLLAGMGWCGDWLVCRIFGPAYGGHQTALMLFTAAACLRTLDAPVRAMITASGRPSYLVRSGITAGGVGMALAFVLVPMYGIAGIAAVHVLYNATGLCMNGFQAFGKAGCGLPVRSVVPS